MKKVTGELDGEGEADSRSTCGIIGENMSINSTVDLKNYGTASKKTDQVRMKKELGLFEGVAITVGAIVGSGLFISPKGITAEVGSVGLSLVIWALSGILSTIGAMCYAELGTTFPASGADYHYLMECFGPLPAFLYLWSVIMIFIPVNYAILALVCSQCMMEPFFMSLVDCTSSADAQEMFPQSAMRLLAAALICFVIFLNCYDVRLTAVLQNLFTVAKVASLLVIIATGAVAISNGHTENFQNLFQNSNYDPGSIALAFYSGIYAFGGANSLMYMTEELKNPNKNLPRSIYISLPLLTIIYILVNIAYFSVLTPEELIESSATAITFGEKLLGRWSFIIPVFVAISTFGGLSIGLMISARMLFVGARYGHFPRMLALIKVSRLTPTPSLISLAIFSLIYLFTGEIYTLINYAGFLYSVSTAAVIAGMLWMRWKKPELERPIKISLIFPVVYLIISIFLFVLPIYKAPMEAVLGCTIVITGLPVYYILVKREELPPLAQKVNKSLTIFIQKLFIALPED